MKERKWISKILAIVCILAVAFSSMELPMVANADTGSFEHDVIGVETFTGQDVVPYTAEAKPGNNGSIDGKMLDGVYNFTGASCVYFGTADWYGLRMQLDGQNLKYWIAPNGSAYDKSVTPTEAGCALAGSDVRIKVGFHIVSTNADTTVNVEYKVCIGAYTTTFTLENVNKTQFQFSQRLHVFPNGGTVTVKKVVEAPAFEYEVIGIETLTGQDEVPYTSEVKPGNNLAIEGKLLDGVYKFTGDACVYVGTAGWYGLRIQPDGTNLKYWIAPNGSTYDKSVTPTEAGCDLVGEDVRIQVGIRTVSTNPDGTANMEYKVCIGVYNTIFTLANVNITQFAYAQRLHVVPGSGSLTVKKVPVFEYGVVGVETLTGQDEVPYTSEAKPGNNLAIEGKLLDGVYKFTGDACVYVGTAGWYGLRIQPDGTNLKYWIAPNGSTYDKSVTPTEAGCNLVGEDVRIQVGIRTVSTNPDGTANMEYKVCIGAYNTTFILENVNTAQFLYAQRLHVVPGSGSLTVKKVPSESTPEITYTTILNVKDFTGENTYTNPAGVTKPLSAGAGTLDDVQIVGIYNLSGYPVLQFGTRDGVRFQMAIVGGGSPLRYLFADTTGVHYTQTLSSDIIGTQYLNTDVEIKVGFKFLNKNETAGTADVQIQVNIGDLYEDIFTVEDVVMASLPRNLTLICDANSTMTLKSGESGEPGGGNPEGGNPEGGNPEGGEEDDTQVPDGFVASYETAMKFTDFGVTSDLKVEGSEAKPNGGDTLFLDKVTVEGTFHFTGEASAVYIGSRGWGGLRFGGARGGKFTYQFFDNGGQNALNVVTLTEEEMNCSLLDNDLRIKAGFTMLNVDTATGKADVIIEVQIGDNYSDIFRVNDVLTRNLIRGMHVYAAAGSSVTLKVDVEDLDYIDEADDMEITYNEPLTFFDLGVSKEMVIENNTGRIRVAGKDLNSVSIEGTYNFVGNCILGFGGDWKGLQFQRAGADAMKYMYLDVDGKGGIYSKTVTAEDIGAAIYNEDIKLKVGFTFANEDLATGTADVTIEVCIGDEYRDVFTVLGVQTANLARWMNLYAVDGNGYTGTVMTLRKPYMEPFDFTEYGFTTNWKAELKLK